MKYQLRSETEMIDFLLAVEKCQGTVLLETQEGDMLNLKSQLSKYVFLATAIEHSYLELSVISCSEEDARLLENYIIISK